MVSMFISEISCTTTTLYFDQLLLMFVLQIVRIIIARTTSIDDELNDWLPCTWRPTSAATVSHKLAGRYVSPLTWVYCQFSWSTPQNWHGGLDRMQARLLEGLHPPPGIWRGFLQTLPSSMQRAIKVHSESGSWSFWKALVKIFTSFLTFILSMFATHRFRALD
jgi:hypothetical protein